MPTLTDLIDNLVDDEWRDDVPFSKEVADCQQSLFAAANDDQRKQLLGEWVAVHQPCFFGRFAAKKGLIEYCFITEADLRQGDYYVAGKIAQGRFAWRKKARRGDSHAFIILVLSEAIARAIPGNALYEVTKRVAELYLCREVETDRILTDELFLETKECRSWMVGVNYFAAQGDGRWWKDHRIPGGFAFSMNSVGHMACARRIAKDMDEMDQSKGLHWALTTAMQLIHETKAGRSGRDTWLHEVKDRPESPDVNCQIPLPKILTGMNRCEYGGLYHTDQTIPAAFFDPSPERPNFPIWQDLNLTYLHHDSPDNPDYIAMGLGVVQQ